MNAQATKVKAVAILDLAYKGGQDSKITFIVKLLHYELDFLHLHIRGAYKYIHKLQLYTYIRL